MAYVPEFETAVATGLAIALLVVFVSRIIQARQGLATKIFSPWVQFITREDIDTAVAEEEADKLKLKLFSGETSAKDVPTTLVAEITSTESTPLLSSTKSTTSDVPTKKHTWRTVTLAILGLIQSIARTAVLIYTVVAVSRHELSSFALISPVIFLTGWVYATLKAIARPGLTVPYGIFFVNVFSFLSACGALYAIAVLHLDIDNDDEYSRRYLAVHIANFILSFLGISIIMGMPIHLNGEPTPDEDGLLPALDDFVNLYGWLSFNWMSNFVAIGASRPVEESDIWQLSGLLKARVVMAKFRYFKRSSLLRRLVAANALDLSTDFVFTVVSASLSVSQPFLLNLTLKALEGSEVISSQGVTTFSAASMPLSSLAKSLPDFYYAVPSAIVSYSSSLLGLPQATLFRTQTLPDDIDPRQMAYFYATISFIFGLIKAQSDLQHLYYSRRASVRAQSELIGSIYEKSLVRKDITGAVASDAMKKATAKKGQDGKDGKDQDKAVASADVGKIVSLIATDATQCSNVANMLTRIYEIPIFFVGSCTLLYTLMGWTAFIGYVTFLFAMPLNWLLMSALWKLRKTLLDVRDKRMREMNQVIQAIKFIKFFAWEEKWVERVMEARKREMMWLRKNKWLQFMMSFFWDVVPLVVTVISFMGFVIIAKGELTVAIAFPALTGFSLLTQALTMIPMIANFLIQTYASVVRIEKYLEEDEVPEWVSWQSETRMAGSTSFTSPSSYASAVSGGAQGFDERVGFDNASFAWVSPNKEEVKDPKKKTEKPKPTLSQRIQGIFKKRKAGGDSEAPEATEEEAEEDKPFELHKLDVWFKLGGLNLISGPTGSGKSSVLSALLGEMACTSGTVHLPKSPLHVDPTTGLRSDVSFCAQQPWLQHQSIKDNILFGTAYEEKRYKDVLRVCQLNTDLDLLEDGDMTEIGEKGVSLSGGQKARVALARAVYSRSKTVLLDDVLSAVDSHTAERLIDQCLSGPLMKNRTVILITHHVDLVIGRCEWVIQLEEGAIVAQGTPDDLRKQGLLTAIRESGKKESEATDPVGDEIAEMEESEDVNAKKDEKDKPARKLVDKEEKAEGRVKLSVYHVYVKAASYLLMAIGVLLIFIHYAGEVSLKFWMRFWGESYEKQGKIALGFPRPQDNVWPYLLGYIFLQVVTALITVLSQIPSVYSSLRASRELYRSMLLSVIRAPSRWFDKTPSGRILNRFSKDIDTVDSNINQYLLMVIESSLASLTTILTILWGAPLFIFPLIVIALLQAYISRGYVSVSRDMRRIESNTRSPIIASFSELINGISTVRAFGTERYFVNKVYKRLDRVQAASYYYWMCNRWLLYRLDSMGAFVILFATLISIASGISSGLAGIVISSSSGLIMNLYWLLRFYTELEQSMNSVERINDYMDIPSEPASIIEGHRPPAYWPSNQGGVSVENLVLKYSPELEPVLHGVSFDIKPCEKIGLVGRTGSGKSTLALAFFRFVDPDSGKITIDGIDITSIGLQDLRSRLTIIPQDAVLFAGTIRDNLDPFNEHSDEDCLDALRRVQLRTSASPYSTNNPSRQSSRPGSPHDNSAAESSSESAAASTLVSDRSKTIITLDTQVSEGGNNFSSGQRQLIAMARALLRRSRFVVMDESTASVDFATDQKIQEAIREEFKESILITIAHRLRTVIDYDRILVLDAGKVAEFDTPKNLIAKEDGIFRGMCVKSGDFDELKEAADRRAEW